ncbi:MAG: ATP-binding protein [Streptomyces sp.]|nr:ATP-binding protein [Streptomyces sp.]
MPLPHAPKAAGTARRHVRDVLDTWCVDGELTECVEVVASELVTNAVRHAGHADGVIALTMLRSAKRLRLEVDDPDRRPPVWPVGPVPDSQERGRGLVIVAALSKDWGHYARPLRGKVVWADFAVP